MTGASPSSPSVLPPALRCLPPPAEGAGHAAGLLRSSAASQAQCARAAALRVSSFVPDPCVLGRARRAAFSPDLFFWGKQGVPWTQSASGPRGERVRGGPSGVGRRVGQPTRAGRGGTGSVLGVAGRWGRSRRGAPDRTGTRAAPLPTVPAAAPACSRGRGRRAGGRRRPGSSMEPGCGAGDAGLGRGGGGRPSPGLGGLVPPRGRGSLGARVMVPPNPPGIVRLPRSFLGRVRGTPNPFPATGFLLAHG